MKYYHLKRTKSLDKVKYKLICISITSQAASLEDIML